MEPVFRVELGLPIIPGACTVGKFDGEHSTFAAATSGGKVLLHRPHLAREDSSTNGVSFLNINKDISSLAAGRLDPSTDGDILVVGTKTSLLGYEVERNKDVVYVDVPEGIYSMIVGKIGSIDKPLILVGGNCSIQGFDHEGSEEFWTTTGDVVSTLALCDVENDGVNELLVGSEDYEIRIFHNEEVVAELTETEAISNLCAVEGPCYAYQLANGTVGMYNQRTRVWRQKTNKVPTALVAFDLNGDGKKEVVAGWSDGTFEVRDSETGEIEFSDRVNGGVAAILVADYMKKGEMQLLVCSGSGELRGYNPRGASVRGGANLAGKTAAELSLDDLNVEKQRILHELRAYESQVSTLKEKGEESAMVPVSTRFGAELEVNSKKNRVDLIVGANNDTVVRVAVIFAEHIFPGESFVVHPSSPSRVVRVPLSPPRNVEVPMTIKACVGYKGSDVFQVFEEEIVLPQFSLFMIDKANTLPEPEGGVTFTLAERANRIKQWLKTHFILSDGVGMPDGNVNVSFTSLRSRMPLYIRFSQESNECEIKTDSMELAGELVQSLCSYLNIDNLESKAHFPREMERLHLVLQSMQEYKLTSQKLTAEIADASNMVKTLVVRAEDARLSEQMSVMNRTYSMLYDVNRDLMGEYKKRANNFEELRNCVREVHNAIQQASRLRMGTASSQVVAECREAFRTDNTSLFFKIISLGKGQ